MLTPESFVAVTGAAGHLGSLIALSLRKRNIAVKALVRPGTAASRTQKLRDAGVTIAEVEMANVLSPTETLEGASIVVSAPQGLRDVIIDIQRALLNAAVAAKVLRFIPSDFALGFTKTVPGSNRNLDLRREFHAKLDESGIKMDEYSKDGLYGTPYSGPIAKINDKYPELVWTTMEQALKEADAEKAKLNLKWSSFSMLD